MDDIKNKNVIFGPYVGDFETEVAVFLPHIRWIKENFDFKKIYVNSHFNREFLYKDICNEFIPIYKHLSRNESQQRKHCHVSITKKDFEYFCKIIKAQIKKDYDDSIDSIFFLPYTKQTPFVSIYQKSFKKIISNFIPNKKNYILFIPDNRSNISIIKYINEYLKTYENVIVAGNLKTHLIDENIILKKMDCIDVVYDHMIGYINNADMVICPCSHWTMICNLNNIPVLSWSDQVSQYKEEGNYHFGNKNCLTFPFYKNSNKKILENQIDYFVNKFK